jgi:quercetin dioxygenase-like cupin family protein
MGDAPVIVPDRVRLPLEFDAGALAAEVLALPSESWIPHFNRSVYEGEWGGVPLRSVGGAPRLYPNPAAQEPYADTAVLDQCPECNRVLEQFHSPLRSVRLLALAPGAVIKEHTDYRLAWEDGEVRIHVPVITAPEVEFWLNGSRVDMAAGTAWYLNLSEPHRVENRSERDRIHLVIDSIVDDWLTDLMRGALGSDGSD